MGRDFAGVFCSFAILLSQVIKVINVYFELTPVTVKCLLIRALSVMTIQMYLILFIKIWAIPSCIATTDRNYTSLEVKDGWESLISEILLSDGHSAVIRLQSGSLIPPNPVPTPLPPGFVFSPSILSEAVFGMYHKRKNMDVFIFLNLFMK